MRPLLRPPTRIADQTGPRFGSFRGGLPPLDLGSSGRGRLWEFLHDKRWTYAAVADADVFAAAAVVSLGYASTALAFALDRRTGRLLFDRSVVAPVDAASFSDDGAGRRTARFRFGRASLALGDGGVSVDFGGGDHPFHVGVRTLGDSAASTPVGATVPIDGGFASTTEKRIADAEGEVVAQGMRFVLARPIIGFDHSRGYLARETTWRWAFGLGRLASGVRVGFNVVQGFVGEAECAAWVGDEVYPLGEGRFTHGDPRSPWRVETACGGLEVLFRPAAVHREEKELVVVRSRFVQPVGAFEGRLTVGGETVTLARLPGVTEHQDVVW